LKVCPQAILSLLIAAYLNTFQLASFSDEPKYTTATEFDAINLSKASYSFNSVEIYPTLL